jgi:hypothetical protein
VCLDLDPVRIRSLVLCNVNCLQIDSAAFISVAPSPCGRGRGGGVMGIMEIMSGIMSGSGAPHPKKAKREG